MADTQGQDLGALPNWDLSDLYPGQDSAALKSDLAKVEKDARSFNDAYKGRLAGIDGRAFGAAIVAYEAIQEITGRIMSYAQLVYSGNVADPEIGKFYQTMRERVTTISTDLIFFTLEINELDDAVLEAKLAEPETANYAPWLRDVRLFRPHQLSEDMERLLHEKYVAGPAAWNRLFDETMAGLRFPFDGKTADHRGDAASPLRPRRRGAREGGQVARSGAAPERAQLSASSPTRWPRIRRSTTSGATIRSPASRPAISATRSRTRWWTRWSRPSRRPTRACRTPITR